MGVVISDFSLPENTFLSNFYKVEIVFGGLPYPTTEHAYQAAKTVCIDERMTFTTGAYITAGKAKRLGSLLTLRKDWLEVRVKFMEDINNLKFSQEHHPELVTMLLNTDTSELIEGNTWGDTFWGVCNGIGDNHLGKILMKIRDELRSSIK